VCDPELIEVADPRVEVGSFRNVQREVVQASSALVEGRVVAVGSFDETNQVGHRVDVEQPAVAQRSGRRGWRRGLVGDDDGCEDVLVPLGAALDVGDSEADVVGAL
jgi:hypothetical protein